MTACEMNMVSVISRDSALCRYLRKSRNIPPIFTFIPNKYTARFKNVLFKTCKKKKNLQTENCFQSSFHQFISYTNSI